MKTFILTVSLIGVMALNTFAADYTYSATANGNWGASTVWSPNITNGPSTTDNIIGNTSGVNLTLFGGTTTTSFAVNNFEVTTGGLTVVGNTTTKSLSIGGTLTIDSAAGSSGLTVRNGTGAVTLTVNNVSVGSGATLYLGASASLSGVSFSNGVTLNGGNSFVKLNVDGGANLGTITFSGSGAGTILLATSGTAVTKTVTASGITDNGGSGFIYGASQAPSSMTLAINGAGSYSTSASLRDSSGTGAAGGLLAVSMQGGTQTFSGASSYSGGTTVSGGTLLVSNTTGSGVGVGAVSVASGASFGGTGIVALSGSSAISVASGGKLLPGGSGSIGTLTLDFGSTTGGLSLSTGSHMAVDLGGGGSSDTITLLNYTLGDLSVASSVNLDLTNGQMGSFTLFQVYSDGGSTLYNGTISNLSNFVINGLTGTLSGEVMYNDAGIVTLMVIPEPSSIVLMALGLFAFGVLALRYKSAIRFTS